MTKIRALMVLGLFVGIAFALTPEVRPGEQQGFKLDGLKVRAERDGYDVSDKPQSICQMQEDGELACVELDDSDSFADLLEGTAHAQAIAQFVNVVKIKCNTAGHARWRHIDGGVDLFATIDCGINSASKGYRALKCQNRNRKDDAGTGRAEIYWGGGPNFNAAQATWGQEQCADCDDGPSIPIDINYAGGASQKPLLHCAQAGTVDSGADIFCICAG